MYIMFIVYLENVHILFSLWLVNIDMGFSRNKKTQKSTGSSSNEMARAGISHFEAIPSNLSFIGSILSTWLLCSTQYVW